MIKPIRIKKRKIEIKMKKNIRIRIGMKKRTKINDNE